MSPSLHARTHLSTRRLKCRPLSPLRQFTTNVNAMSSAEHLNTTGPESPSVSPIRRFGAVAFGDFAAISLVVIGLLMLLPVGEFSALAMIALAILAVALVRILTETLWGTSPGKHLSGLAVAYRNPAGTPRHGAQRLLPAVIRNAWLWIPVLLSLIMPENILSGLAATALISLILRKDGRPLTDRLAGARVIDAPKPQKGAR